MRRCVEGVAVLLLALAVAGCGGDGIPPSSQEAFCLGTGYAHSVVNVNGRQLLARHQDLPMNVYTCVQGRCTGGHYPVASQRTSYVGQSSGFHVTTSRRVAVHVTAVSRGHTLFDGKTTVRLHRGYINGKGCPPTTWFAQVSTHGADKLRQDHVSFDEMSGGSSTD